MTNKKIEKAAEDLGEVITNALTNELLCNMVRVAPLPPMIRSWFEVLTRKFHECRKKF